MDLPLLRFWERQEGPGGVLQETQFLGTAGGHPSVDTGVPGHLFMGLEHRGGEREGRSVPPRPMRKEHSALSWASGGHQGQGRWCTSWVGLGSEGGSGGETSTHFCVSRVRGEAGALSGGAEREAGDLWHRELPRTQKAGASDVDGGGEAA